VSLGMMSVPELCATSSWRAQVDARARARLQSRASASVDCAHPYVWTTCRGTADEPGFQYSYCHRSKTGDRAAQATLKIPT
jgi:hypothetical protein